MDPFALLTVHALEFEFHLMLLTFTRNHQFSYTLVHLKRPYLRVEEECRIRILNKFLEHLPMAPASHGRDVLYVC